MISKINTILVAVLFINFPISVKCIYNNVCERFEDYRTLTRNPRCRFDPDVWSHPRQIAKNHGFPFEVHEVVSKDGYIITLFRVPHNGSNWEEQRRPRPPVLLHHGIAFDSSTFMWMGKASLAFVLANQGYDVWLTNARGSKYSPKHLKYSVYHKEFWDFSFHEMAVHDLPAVIDYIALKTGQKGQLSLIGYSMGTTIGLIYTSTFPEHSQQNVKTFIALAPVAFMDNVKSVVRILRNYLGVISKTLAPIDAYGLGPNTPILSNLLSQACTVHPALVFCGILVEMLVGSNPGEIPPEFMPVIFTHAVSGFSFKTFLHYGQIMNNTESFQMFDYGPVKNMELYKTLKPQQYQLDKISVPVHLFYGKNDYLSDEKDVMRLYNSINSEKSIRSIFEEDKNFYAHSDFVAGQNSMKLYKLILQRLNT